MVLCYSGNKKLIHQLTILSLFNSYRILTSFRMLSSILHLPVFFPDEAMWLCSGQWGISKGCADFWEGAFKRNREPRCARLLFRLSFFLSGIHTWRLAFQQPSWKHEVQQRLPHLNCWTNTSRFVIMKKTIFFLCLCHCPQSLCL